MPPTPPTPLPPAGVPGGTTFNERLRTIISRADSTATTSTKFNLDFPGGTPHQLVAAVEKAGGKPVNVILPSEYADAQLPPIKVNGVDVPQLFQALLEASYKYSYGGDRREVVFSQGFTTTDNHATEDSIWRFSTFTSRSRFDLDFPGGRPRELVAAIEKATGRPLNAIVPDDLVDTKLPPLKMKDVDIVQLFDAVQATSLKQEVYSPGNAGRPPGGYGGFNASYQIANTAYGFRTKGTSNDDSIWYFFVERPPVMPSLAAAKVCRYYALAPYMEDGITVDDLTTAIQTGWKLLGETNPPTVSFHKDTKLLIAVGEPDKLETIDGVLKALKPPTPAPPSAKPGLPVLPAGKPVNAPKADQ